jgi:hypothetical protein
MKCDYCNNEATTTATAEQLKGKDDGFVRLLCDEHVHVHGAIVNEKEYKLYFGTGGFKYKRLHKLSPNDTVIVKSNSTLKSIAGMYGKVLETRPGRHDGAWAKVRLQNGKVADLYEAHLEYIPPKSIV